MSAFQPDNYGSPPSAAYSYQPSSQLLGVASGVTDWMGPWSPAIYSGRLDTPNFFNGANQPGTASARAQKNANANLFEMNFRGAVPSPSLGLPESNARGGWDDSDLHQSTQQPHEWAGAGQQRKRASSSPALWGDSSSRQQQPGASYFDGQHQPYQQQQAPHGKMNHDSAPQSHPDMHDSINAISSLANFNQNQPMRQSTRNPPPSEPTLTAAPTAGAGTRSKRQRKAPAAADDNINESVSPQLQTKSLVKDENDELEHDDDGGETGAGVGGKEGMDAEAQRKDLLDRNRIAARKSREKRKREVQALEQTIRNYTSQNASLHSLTVSLSAELQQLRDLLQNHNQCVHGGQGGPPPPAHHVQRVPQPIMSGGGRRR